MKCPKDAHNPSIRDSRTKPSGSFPPPWFLTPAEPSSLYAIRSESLNTDSSVSDSLNTDSRVILWTLKVILWTLTREWFSEHWKWFSEHWLASDSLNTDSRVILWTLKVILWTLKVILWTLIHQWVILWTLKVILWTLIHQRVILWTMKLILFIQSYFVSDFSFCFKDAFFGLFNYSKENTGKYYVINLCFLLAKFHIHKQKFTGSKPLFSLFKVELDSMLKLSKILLTWKLWKLYLYTHPLGLFKCNFITLLLFIFCLTLASLSVYSWILFIYYFIIIIFFIFVYNCNC